MLTVNFFKKMSERYKQKEKQNIFKSLKSLIKNESQKSHFLGKKVK